MSASDPATASAFTTLRRSGWQGIALIAATYLYFLLFAQFGFLNRLAELGITDSATKPVLALMALGGIIASLLAPRLRISCPRCRLQGALSGCALAALLSRLSLSPTTAALVALLIGLSIGLLTVTLVTYLPRWLGNHNALLKVGIGTGLGYFCSNIPFLFNAAPRQLALYCALATLLAILCAFANLEASPDQLSPTSTFTLSFPWVLVLFTALIWFDSAAFFIIQNSALLKAGTWTGNLALFRNGSLHFIAALLSAALLSRKHSERTLVLAFLLLASACLLFSLTGGIDLSALLYPIGVSLYSVALVAYPALLSSAPTPQARARQAGWLYAIAGWVGSALGIGMAQHLHTVPWQFIAAATALIALPFLFRLQRTAQIQIITVAAVLLIAALLNAYLAQQNPPTPQLSAIDRGRKIYLNEGCINCHSQYLRPATYDTEYWGPASDLSEIRKQQPPLIGNRRQGPDLTNIGLRRSTLWLRIHFFNPRDLSYNSPMPRYDYLFNDARIDDLISYLASLQSPSAAQDREQIRATWTPAPYAMPQSQSIAQGRELFQQLCATCHDAGGHARWYSGFKRLPPDLASSPLLHLDLKQPPAQLQLSLARIIKFGIPATDMPGHEYLSDPQISALAYYLLHNKLLPRATQRLSGN